MIDQYTDEERAFRDGLRKAAEAEEFEALNPAVAARRRRAHAWTGWAGAAAVVAVIALIGVFALPRVASFGSAVAPAAAPEIAPYAGGTDSSAADRTSAGETPSKESNQPDVGGGLADLGQPLPGFRWESRQDVAVQVPQSWGYGVAPRSDWCAETDSEPVAAAAPFVDLGAEGTRSIRCPGAVPAELLQLNLQFWANPYQGPEVSSPWHYRTVTLGDVTIAVTTDGSQDQLVDQILGSARRV